MKQVIIFEETPKIAEWREMVDTHGGMNVEVSMLQREVAEAPENLRETVEALPDPVWMLCYLDGYLDGLSRRPSDTAARRFGA